FENVAPWAGLHHEKPNGKGYPFGLKEGEIPFGALIMGTADVFSALAETRPYRRGLDREKVTDILRENVAGGALSGVTVELLLDNYELIDAARREASRQADEAYYKSISGGDVQKNEE
ncbi:MAG: hypothetical protein II794_06080, partial [Oscillospiraceae bacterium]|nr:hypothetical protein [Oscillospiraceae bacterium]